MNKPPGVSALGSPRKLARVPARWETVQFPADARDGKLVALASGRGHAGAIPLYADGALYAGRLKAGEAIRQRLEGKPAALSRQRRE